MRVVACNAPYNEGGVGRSFATVVEEARRAGTLAAYYTTGAKPNDPLGHEISLRRYRWVFRATPLRFSPAWRDFAAAELFDRAVARRLTAADELSGYSGRTRHTFMQARRLGYTQLSLEAATSHVTLVRRQHEQAIKRHGVESSWLNEAQYQKTLKEYELADEIVVISEYSRQSFLREGVPASKLRRRVQTVAARFAPPVARVKRDGFTIIYVGRLHVTKGTIDLLDAFARFNLPEAELVLVGGCATDAMEKHLAQRVAVDRRIRISPGDPLPHLHRADVFVNPSYEDALAFAPLEALAAGVPVIVSEDTGMKEYVDIGTTGYVVPTGNVDAIVDALHRIRERPLRGALPETLRA